MSNYPKYGVLKARAHLRKEPRAGADIFMKTLDRGTEVYPQESYKITPSSYWLSIRLKNEDSTGFIHKFYFREEVEPLEEAEATANPVVPFSAKEPRPKLPTQPATLPIEPIFTGYSVAFDDIIWANGFGANDFAKNNGDLSPSDPKFDERVYKNSGGIHPGLDFGAAANTPVMANVHGRVTIPSKFPGDAGDPGNVVVQLDNGMWVVYGHVIGKESLTNDMVVKPGEVIGKVGNQGANSHVHLALRELVRVHNPAYYFADPSELEKVNWSGYIPGEDLFSIKSYNFSPKSFWIDGEEAIGVIRPLP